MDARFRFGVIGFLALIAAAVWLFPTWYPLIDRDSVPNPFPGLEESAWEAFLSLPQTQQTAYKALRDGNSKEKIPARPGEALALVRAQVIDTDIPAPEEEATYTPPDGSVLLRDGVFRQIDAIRWARGTISIYQLQNNQRVLRFDSTSEDEGAETFQTVRAPDLHVIFTRNPDPLDAAGVGVDYIDVGPLKATVGNQTYQVPESVDFSLYPVLALYSPSINMVISAATLR
jgi:hypothetical protein